MKESTWSRKALETHWAKHTLKSSYVCNVACWIIHQRRGAMEPADAENFGHNDRRRAPNAEQRRGGSSPVPASLGSLTLPISSSIARWIEAKRAEIERSYQHWSQVDYWVWSRNYSFRDISAWPVDAVPVFETEKVLYLLGTLKAAASLSDVCAGYCCRVDTLVTLCADDLKVTGAPCDWRSFCTEQNVSQFVYSYQDLTVTCSQNPVLFVQQANLATKLWETLRRDLTANQTHVQKHVVLFHCFGCIDRSSAALGAMLIAMHGFLTDEAIAWLLCARPALRPWNKRDAVLWALHECAELHRPSCEMRDNRSFDEQ